mgnify:CR=1
ARGLAPAFVTRNMRDEPLVASVMNGRVGSFSLDDLDNENARDTAYQHLVDRAAAPPLVSELQRQKAIQGAVFFALYNNPSSRVTDAARKVLNDIQTKVTLYKYLDLMLDA